MVDLSPLEGKTVFITGLSGLVGQSIASAIREVPGITIVDPLREAPTKLEPDFIVHGAGYAQPARFMAAPVTTILINTQGTLDMLCRLKPCGKFLFLSSSEIYTGCQHFPHAEEDIGMTSPSHARAPYIEGKRSGEAIVEINNRWGVLARSARLSMIYGPGVKVDDTRVMSSLIRQALVDKEVRLLDNGQAIRTFCYVDDAVEMILNILLYGVQSVYNVGGVWTTSILSLATLISFMCDVPFVIPKAGAIGLDAPGKVQLDISRYETEFGAMKFMGIEDGLRRTIEHHKGLYA